MRTFAKITVLDNIVITFGLFVLTASFMFLMGSGGTLELGNSNPKQLLMALALYGVTTSLLVWRPGDVVEMLQRRPDVVLIALWPLASCFWAADPGVVFRRAAAHALTVVFCLYLVSRLTPEQLLRRLMIVLAIGGVLSLVVGTVLPGIGVTQGGPNAGAWRGIYGHKVFLGRMCVVAICAALSLPARNRNERWVRFIVLSSFSLLLLLSQSRTSWLLAIGCMGALLVFNMLRAPRLSKGLKITVAALAAIGVVGFGVASFTGLLSAFGRDMTFSGRTNLWNAAIHVASETHPWVGVGYRGFWVGETAEEVRSRLVSFHNVLDHAHNGYLDTWLELGYFGLAILIGFALLTLVRIVKRLLQEPGEAVWVALALQLVVFLLGNSAATLAFMHSDLAWAMVLLGALYTIWPARAGLGAPQVKARRALRVPGRYGGRLAAGRP